MMYKMKNQRKKFTFESINEGQNIKVEISNKIVTSH